MDMKKINKKLRRRNRENLAPIMEVQLRCKKTFDLNNTCENRFMSNLEQLKRSIDMLTAEHFDLNLGHMCSEYWSKPQKAPCTYVKVLKTDLIGIGVLILKPGYVIPFHKHGSMYRFLKVLSGNMIVSTYTASPIESILPSFDSVDYQRYLGLKEDCNEDEDDVFYAKSQGIELYDQNDKSLLLTPLNENVHDIMAACKNEPLVFLEVISPPQSPLTFKWNDYYKITNRFKSKYVRMERILNDFPSDIENYNGPTLT